MSASQPRRWGWHRLSDDWSRRLVDAAGIAPGDLVLDIGAGTGALTTPLVAAGARVIAVELHPARARELSARFDPSVVTVVRTDATDLRLPRRPFKVVANPPFGTTAAILRRLLHRGSRMESGTLLVPRTWARRWTGPGAPAWTSPGGFDLRVGPSLPRRAFRPPPPLDVVVLAIERRTPDGRRPPGRR